MSLRRCNWLWKGLAGKSRFRERSVLQPICRRKYWLGRLRSFSLYQNRLSANPRLSGSILTQLESISIKLPPSNPRSRGPCPSRLSLTCAVTHETDLSSLYFSIFPHACVRRVHSGNLTQFSNPQYQAIGLRQVDRPLGLQVFWKINT